MTDNMPGSSLRKYGIIDNRWSITDKITMFRGLTALYGRDQKLQLECASEMREKEYNSIRKLARDVQNWRETLDNIMAGDRIMLQTTLQRQKDILLAYQKHMPQASYDYLDYLTCTQRKQLDLLEYEKKKRTAYFHKLMSEKMTIEANLEALRKDYTQRLKELAIQNKIQDIFEKQKRALSFVRIYESILAVQRRDVLVYNSVLKALQTDSYIQSQCVIQTVEMYQMALEDVATLEADSKTLEKSIISNMKAKEATLKALRDELYDLTDECKALTCREGDEDLKDQVEKTPSEMELAEELNHLERTMRKIQNCTSVSICDEIFPRIKNQLNEKQWIVERLQRASQLYYNTSERKGSAEMAAVSLRNAISEIACKYENDKSEVVEETQSQQQLIDQCNEDIKEKGKMFIMIRMSLQMLYSKLDCIRRPTDKIEPLISEIAASSKDILEEKKSEESIVSLPSEDPLEILRQVMIRSRKLISHATQALNEEELEDARALFQTTVTEIISKAEYGEADKEEQEIMVDYDVDDPSVLTRAEIKTTSKKIVAQFEKSLYDF